MENNFDLRKFLAEGSLANSPKQINEDFERGQQGGEQGDQEQQRQLRYGDPCSKLEDQLMNLYDKHGDELLDFIERIMRLVRSGQKGGAMRLARSFKNFVGFTQIAMKAGSYQNKGCGNALHFFADYMGADHIVDFMETMMSENVQENETGGEVVDTLKTFFGLKEDEQMNEGEDEQMNEFFMKKDREKFKRIFNRHNIDDKGFFQELHDFVFGQPRKRKDGEGNSVDRFVDDLFEEESINEGRGNLEDIIDAIENHAEYGTDGYNLEEALEEIFMELGDHYGYDISFTKRTNEGSKGKLNEGRGNLETIIGAIESQAEYGTDGYNLEEAFEEIFAELGDHYGYDISFTKRANEGKEEE